MKHHPLFSIIIVAYNAEDLIADTVKSVLAQNYGDFEIIVKDACSTDKTLERIPEDERIRVFSTKDDGIYSGMNEAIGYANGLYCMFLNCGDCFHDETVLERVSETVAAHKDTAAIVYGDYYRGAYYAKQPSEITPFYLYRTPLNHQSMFFSTELFSRLGPYNTDLKIAADYDFTLRAFRTGVPFVYCPVAVSDYLGGGASESEKGVQIKTNDYKVICSKYFSASDRTKYDLLLALSMRKLRKAISGGKGPKFLKKIYRTLVNLVNR